MLADLPPAREAELLEEFDGRAEQETARRLTVRWLIPCRPRSG
ncbi:MAG TPA: hypothetical protein VJX66_30210 [Amycolatopsis sp.]|nr:hypothetical protein [Amycolatopsis sp.]